MAVHLPIEIHDLILDALLPLDKELEKPLSAVCQHWRQRVYRHVFSDSHIHQSSATKLSRLLESPFSSFAILPSIRNLRLHTTGHKTWTFQGLLALNRILLKVARHENLTTLVLSNDFAGDHQLDFPGLMPPLLRSVSTLKLRRVAFRDPSGFSQLFRTLPAVRHVEFDEVLCTWAYDQQLRLPPGEFSLALVVHDVLYYQTNIKWTLKGPASSLEPEDLCSLGLLIQADLNTLIRRIGPGLRELDVDLQLDQLNGFSLEGIVNALDLTNTPHLRHIRIGSSAHVLSFMHWVPRVLYNLAPTDHPTLKVLAIRFASSRQFHLDRPFLRCLTKGLRKKQYSAVCKVHFIVYHDSPFDKGVERAITQSIQDDLVHYHEQGLVWIDFRARES